MGFKGKVLRRVDYLGWGADDGAQEFLFGDLFQVGEAEFGEEFLREREQVLGRRSGGRETNLVVNEICFERG